MTTRIFRRAWRQSESNHRRAPRYRRSTVHRALVRALRLALSLSLIALTQCGSAGAITPSDASFTTDDAGYTLIPFELGTGATQWEDIPAQGAHVPLIMGPQGGYHVLGRVRFSGFSPDVNVRFRVECTSSGTVFNDVSDVLRRRERQGLINTGTYWESSSSELVIFTQIRSPADAAGHAVRWEVTLEEAATGRRARAYREFVVDYP